MTSASTRFFTGLLYMGSFLTRVRGTVVGVLGMCFTVLSLEISDEEAVEEDELGSCRRFGSMLVPISVDREASGDCDQVITKFSGTP